jgi:hypothetical protein
VNPAQKKEQDEVTEHELFRFLGGDVLARRITGALLRDGYLTSVELLREEWGKDGHGFVLDVRLIGGKAVDRIAEKMGVPW